MPALVAGIHVFLSSSLKTWMAGTLARTRFALRPAMTKNFHIGYFTTAAVWPNSSLRSSSVRIEGWPKFGLTSLAFA